MPALRITNNKFLPTLSTNINSLLILTVSPQLSFWTLPHCSKLRSSPKTSSPSMLINLLCDWTILGSVCPIVWSITISHKVQKLSALCINRGQLLQNHHSSFTIFHQGVQTPCFYIREFHYPYVLSSIS